MSAARRASTPHDTSGSPHGLPLDPEPRTAAAPSRAWRNREDAPASEAGGLRPMGVRLPPPALPVDPARRAPKAPRQAVQPGRQSELSERKGDGGAGRGSATVESCRHLTGSSSSRATSPGRLWARSSTRPTRRCSAAVAWTERSTGDAKATRAGDLPADYVIHSVGPVWRGGDEGEEELLASCHRRALEVAAELGCRTVAFPAISTGVYRFPVERAARVALRTIVEQLEQRPEIEQVRFVLFSDEHRRTFERELARLRQTTPP